MTIFNEELPSMSSVVITAPHAYCPQNPIDGHECDFLARDAALLLNDALISRNVSVQTLLPDEQDARRFCDSNRAICRRTPYRARVSEAAAYRDPQKASPQILFDVHSFPAGDEPFGDARGKDKSVDVIVLDDDTHQKGVFHPGSVSLVNWLSVCGFRVALILGEENDVIDEANQFLDSRERTPDPDIRFVAVLLEFNESLTADAKLSQLTDAIAEWASRLLHARDPFVFQVPEISYVKNRLGFL